MRNDVTDAYDAYRADAERQRTVPLTFAEWYRKYLRDVPKHRGCNLCHEDAERPRGSS